MRTATGLHAHAGHTAAILARDQPHRVMAIQTARRIAAEHELEIISGKVAPDHVHVFLSYRPPQKVSQIVQWLKGTSSRVLLQEFPQLRKVFWGPAPVGARVPGSQLGHDHGRDGA